MKGMIMYRPLPECLTIRESQIDGLGLFATEDIPAHTDLGMCHFYDSDGTLHRTPLGAFYNHNDDANCIKTWDGEHSWHLVTKRHISKDEELTVKYTFYKIS